MNFEFYSFMIKSSYLSYLLSLIKTRQYAEEIIQKLDELKDCLYNKRIDLDKKMSELFSFELKEKIKAYSWQEGINLNDPESFGKFISNLRMVIKSMPVVTIQIAFEPDEGIVKEVSAWFVENYGKNVLVDLVYNKDIIAAAIIVFDKENRDLSLKKKIEEMFKPEDWKRFVEQVRGEKAGSEIQQTNGEAAQTVSAPTSDLF